MTLPLTRGGTPRTYPRALVEALTRFARESSSNAMLASANPTQFVNSALRANPELLSLAADLSVDDVRSTTWDAPWLQPLSEPW